MRRENYQDKLLRSDFKHVTPGEVKSPRLHKPINLYSLQLIAEKQNFQRFASQPHSLVGRARD